MCCSWLVHHYTVYLPTLTPAGWKNFDLTLAGQFLTPDWKMWVLATLLDNFQKYVNSDKPCEKWINDNTFLVISDSWSKKQWEWAHVICVLRLRKTSDFFGILRTSLEMIFKNPSTPRIKISRLYQKKLAGILYCVTWGSGFHPPHSISHTSQAKYILWSIRARTLNQVLGKNSTFFFEQATL